MLQTSNLFGCTWTCCSTYVLEKQLQLCNILFRKCPLESNYPGLYSFLMCPKRWKTKYFGRTFSQSFYHRSGKVRSYWTASINYEHLSKTPLCMCVSTESARCHLDVRGPEDGWPLVFRGWESSLTDSITSQQACRFSLITPQALHPPNGCGYGSAQVPSQTSQSVMLQMCGLLMWYLHWLWKTSMTDCQHSSNHFDFSIQGWITLEWTLSDPRRKDQD